MMHEFRLPDVGEGLAEAEIVEWLVGVDDEVRQDQALATVETDKAVVEMPSPVAGTVRRLGGQPGDVLKVGDVLAVIEAAQPVGTTPTAPAPPTAPASPASPDAAAAPAGPADGVPPPPVGRAKASPAVRKLALTHAVDLVGLTGTGPAGRITREDVLAAAGNATEPGSPEVSAAGAARAPGQPTPHPARPEERVAFRGLRRQVARKMAESWRSVPHITDFREVDASGLLEVRAAVTGGVGPFSFVPLVVKIVAVALQQHPIMNASLDEEAEEIVLHSGCHVGVATATPDGLLVPVLRDCDRKSVAELAAELAELIPAARERRATPAQLGGGTYTVNNVGALQGVGASYSTPIIRTPEVGILAFGRITDRVVAVDGRPAVRPTVLVSSVGDHRVVDGDTLGAFTDTVVTMMERPHRLLTELR